MRDFSFHSEQIRTVIVNGEAKEIRETTDVKGNSGTKTVIQRNGNAELEKTLPLTQEEVRNIQGRIFMPKLFKPCHDCLRGRGPSVLLDPLGPRPSARSKTRAKTKAARSKRRSSKKASK